MLRDEIRFSLRQLRKNPGFTLAAVLTLALGVGANATVFTWLQSLVLDPLPAVPLSRDVQALRWRVPQSGAVMSYSWPHADAVSQRARTLNGLAAGRMTALSLGEGERPERIFGMLVTGNYFRVLGVPMALGRDFRPEENRTPGTHPVAVLSHALWRTKFHGDPGILGRSIRLNGRPFTVIGVAAEGFQGSQLALKMDLYTPLMMRVELMGGSVAGLLEPGNRWLEAWARLQPGVTPAAAVAEVESIGAAFDRERGLDMPAGPARAEIAPVWRSGAGQILTPLMLVLASVTAVVLLIACANVANLLLARGASRRREIALRLSLGASRLTVARQLLVESALLAVGGAALGALVSPFTAGLLMRFAPATDVPIAIAPRAGVDVLLFAAAAAGFVTLVAGLAPAWRSSRADLVSALKEDSAGSTARTGGALRQGLVVAQVAMALVLLAAAGLLLRSLANTAAADPGFDPRHALVAGVDLVPNGYTAGTAPALLDKLQARLAALPGVTAVSWVRRLPLGLGGNSSTFITVPGYTPARGEDMTVAWNGVGPDYFHAIGTPVRDGRDFTPADRDGAPPVVIVNQAFVDRYLKGRSSAVGQPVRIAGQTRTIAGVVANSKFTRLDEPAQPFFYLPTLQNFHSEINFVIRTNGDPLALAKALEAAVHEHDAALPVYGVRTLETSVAAASFAQRMGGSLLGIFGALAVLLTGVGLYGVLAYNVTRRRREVGIRLALGSTRAGVMTLVLRQGLRLVALGAAIGLALALAVTRFLKTLLYGVSPADALTFGGVLLVLGVVGVLACWLPARRAARLDPLAALRAE